MALRLYGQKLSPLPAKVHMISRGYSDEDRSFYAEDNEDEPLLSRNTNERKTCDIASLTKDVCAASTSSYKQTDSNRPSLHYTAAENSKTSAFLSECGKHSTACADFGSELSNMGASSSLEKSDYRYDESNPFEDRAILSMCETSKNSETTTMESETFELCILNSFQEEDPKLGAMIRSLSSFDNREHVYVCEDQKSTTHEHGQRRFPFNHRLKPNHKRPAMSRSQSQPIATDEKEYSKYWRGEVTVIEMPAIELPQPKTEQSLDDKMAGSAITRSILMGNSRLVLECLKQGENPHLICTKTGRSYFHSVTSIASYDHEIKWVPMIYQLSNAGVDIDTKDMDGQTAVRMAIKRRLVQILAALLKCGAEFSAADEYHAEQVTGVIKSEMMEVIRRLTPSYWSAIDNYTHFKISRLVKAWSRVNISRNGQSLIEYAKQNAGDATVIKLLVQNEASIELAHAVMAGDTERVKVILCDSTADLTTTDTSVKNNYAPLTLLEAAIKYEHDNVVKVLKEASKPKLSTLIKPDPYIDVGGAKMGDGDRSSLYIQEKSDTGSTRSLGNVIYYGSSHFERDPESVTSTMCAIF